MALLERIAELGGPAHVASLEPRLTDFDPAVAARAAEIIGAWTGTPGNIAPTAPTSPALPTLEELEDLAGRHVLIVMETGDTIEISLRPFDAPTNTARFARLAREGYFNGLTFHRVAPNFVIQGGSRNANEYAGDGPFSRDELTIDANWRGTVGLSTRGRDTGDAQIYINLIDNVRLDHDYTVFGEVVGGMDAVGRVLEGAIMTSVTVQ
jgi:peptidyl-prolyl cis-trans isomerase B (cyclophilin B)